MSEWHVEVVRVGKVEKLENSDTLEITQVNNGYPVIFKAGQFKEGDLAVYIPVDSHLPAHDARWDFLVQDISKPRIRVKAKRLRGTFSMGLLSQADPTWEEGQNVTEQLDIQKWEPQIPATQMGNNIRDPGIMPVYTDIEGLRKYKAFLRDDEPVIITEKIHGCNGRFMWSTKDDCLYVGSHKCVKKEDPNNLWWKIAHKYNMKEALKAVPDVVFYGEVYGQVQDLKYGKSDVDLVLFDMLDTKTGKYLNYADFKCIAVGMDFNTVPELYEGPWKPELVSLSEGSSTVLKEDNTPAGHIREGFVVRPIEERYENRVGRVIFKMIGEGYLLRKEKD